MSKRTWGIILLVLAAVAVVGSIANGTFESEKNLGVYIGYFAGFGALIFFGIRFLKSGE